MKDFFNFEKMVTPTIVKAVYLLGVFGIISSITVAAMVPQYLATGTTKIFILVFYFFLANLLWRVFCESLVLMFSIYARLGELKK